MDTSAAGEGGAAREAGDAQARAPAPPPDEARALVDRACASSAMSGAGRASAVLAHLLQLAVEHPETDSSQHDLADAIYGEVGDTPAERVRSAVGDARRRLARYYQAEGQAEPWRLRIPRGRYRLVFERWPPAAPASGTEAEPARTSTEDAPVPQPLTPAAVVPRSRRRPVLARTLVACALVTALAVAVFAALRNDASTPARAGVQALDVRGTKLVFLDAGGGEIAAHDLGCVPAVSVLWRAESVWFGDRTGDGVDDAETAAWCASRPESLVLVSVDGARGAVAPPAKFASVPEGAARPLAPHFQPVFLRVVGDPGGPPRWIVVGLGHAAHSLGRIVVLDMSRRIIGSYWLWGHPSPGALSADLDADGHVEMLIPYRDDHAGMAGLLVLDPAHVEGYVPHDAGFPPFPADAQAGTHLALHLFPPSPMSPRERRRKTYVHSITPLPGGAIEVSVSDGVALGCAACLLRWRVGDGDVTVEGSDSFDAAWSDGVASGRFAGPLLEELLRSLRNRYRYHDGTRWWPHSPCDDEPCGDD